MTITTQAAIAPRVQFATAFGTWTSPAGYYARRASVGAGQVVGEATITRKVGRVRHPGAVDFTDEEPADQGGHWVRILHPDNDGAVTISGAPYRPVWYGVVDGYTLDDMGGGMGEETLSCTGLAAALARIRLWHGHEYSPIAGDGGFARGMFPPVAALRRGDAATGLTLIDGQSDIRIHDRRRDVTVTKDAWKVGGLAAMVLAAFVREAGDGPAIAIVDDEGVADLLADQAAFHGASVLDVLNALFNARRGLLWRLDGPTDDTTGCNLVLTSTVETAIPGYLPEAATAVPVDLTGLPTVRSLRVRTTWDTAYKQIIAEGSQPWCCLTVAWTPTGVYGDRGGCALVKGWTADQETQWDAGIRNAYTEPVWRRFRFAEDWDLGQWNNEAAGLRTTMAADGSMSREATLPPQPPGGAIETTRETPFGATPDPDNPDNHGFSIDRDGPRQMPIAVVSQDAGATWQAIAGVEGATVSMPLVVEDDPPGVTIGSLDDATTIQGYCASADCVLAFTIGVKEPAPMRAIVAGLGATRDGQQSIVLSVPDARQERLIAGTIIGVNDDGTADTVATETGSNDRARLLKVATAANAFYGWATYTVDWSQGGILRQLLPGMLITNLTTDTGVHPVQGMITRISWDYDSQTTGFSVERMPFGVEGVK